jgi:hypothetical protein
METIVRNRGTPIVPAAGSSRARSAWQLRWSAWEAIPSTALGATDFPRFLVVVSNEENSRRSALLKGRM